MTDKEKLQQLFNAALQDGSSLNKPPTRAFPESKVARASAAEVAAARAGTTPAAITVSEVPAPAPAAAPSPVDLVEPLPNAGLDEETSAELGRLLDAQIERVGRRRRRELVATLLVAFGLVGGGIGWFVSAPARVSAFSSVVSEIRSVGDVKGMMDKYQVALDQIGTRGGEIDEASNAMGVDSATGPNDDPYLEAETESLTGEKGTGVGSRNGKLQEKFGKVVDSPMMAGKQGAQERPPVANR